MALGLCLLAGPGLAQTAPRGGAPATPPPPAATPTPGPATEAPERTTAVFGDWSVQCVTRAQAGRVCEMVQGTQNQQQQPVSVLAIGRLARTEPLRLVARLPVTVLVAQPVKLTLEGDPGLTLPFRYCNTNPIGCFAELELRDEAVLRRLRARNPEQGGKLEFKDPAGQGISIPVSFRGFAAALEALQKEG
ncbi:invasion associated locus B family protein [Siccirubricoccus sp. KC 17139]|uniref:Invasion associated locus B family protein n=1 Tax=Siccirubricoccus soli TaxID=2899147 RepID=A0ABT1D0H7_9PROT|nr:invasion associated locus B family protein [Siccirubricoccus soli]MCO6415415.1 invasion associated locus B family protein [Siccirubricoccus soli]MCP2681547.1 invasion associated locus B family protein [Siccirubricoccus soli]